MAGIVGGGKDSVSQIYVYGKDAYEVTLQGLTFDNKPTMEEINRYQEYTSAFGMESLTDDVTAADAGFANGSSNSNVENVEDELLSSSPGSSSGGGGGGGGGGGVGSAVWWS